MFKVTFYSLLISLFVIQFANAKIWIADANPGDIGADFKTIQAAHDGASAGDTIYVIGSAQSLGNATFTKKLVIIGPGYFLSENSNLQASPLSAKFGQLAFNAGSEGSVITGCEIQGAITIITSNIAIIRDYINGSYILVNPNLGNIYIQQNFFNNNGLWASWVNQINTQGNDGPLFITNNYLKGQQNGSGSISLSPSDNAIIENNIIDGNVTCSNSTFQNNITISGTFSGTGNGIFNNICNSNQFSSTNGNIPNTDTSTVFINTGSTDGRFQLKANSPAKGVGVSGVDIGMYGGVNPYVLSGLPSIPSIYYFTAPFYGSKSQGLQVHIKAKVNN